MSLSLRFFPVFLMSLCAAPSFGCGELIGLSDYRVEPSVSGSSVGGAAAGGAGGMASQGGGGQGGADCVPSAETCNGIDDDCDGVADEPATEGGEGCGGCLWGTLDGQLFAVCPSDDMPLGDLSCPTGTRPVVLQSAAEHDVVSGLVPPMGVALMGLAQDPGSTDRVVGWAWARPGMPVPWDQSQPGDESSAQPNGVENGDEDCGAMLSPNGFPSRVHDAPCAGPNWIACEEIVDECRQGEECLLAQGCRGTFDCSLPADANCVISDSPPDEECNGYDDNCDGTIDEGACGCFPFNITGRDYKICLEPLAARDLHCGLGFVPAMPNSLGERDALISALAPISELVHIGVYQDPNATMMDAGWSLHDGTPFSPALWDVGEPEENGGLSERHVEDCGALRRSLAGVHDFYCANTQPYLCEQQGP